MDPLGLKARGRIGKGTFAVDAIAIAIAPARPEVVEPPHEEARWLALQRTLPRPVPKSRPLFRLQDEVDPGMLRGPDPKLRPTVSSREGPLGQALAGAHAASLRPLP